MPAIPFCCKNLDTIKKDATEIQKLLTQDSFFSYINADFSVGKLLDGFALATGYSSWGSVRVKNRQKRAYLPFSLSNYRDVRSFAKEISAYIEIPEKDLLLAVSLIHLGAVADNKNIYIPDKDDFCSDQVALVLNKSMGDRDYRSWVTALNYEPLYFLLNFDAIPLKILKPIMPELANHLCHNFNKTDNQLVVCHSLYNILYGDAYGDDDDDDDIGLIEMSYQDRAVYCSLYNIEDLDIYEGYTHLLEWLDLRIHSPDLSSTDDETVINKIEQNYLRKIDSMGIKFTVLLQNPNDIKFIKGTKYSYTQGSFQQYFPIDVMEDGHQRMFKEFKKAQSLYPAGTIYFYEKRKHCKEKWLNNDWHITSARMHKQFISYRRRALDKCTGTVQEKIIEHIINLHDIHLLKSGRSPVPLLEMLYPAEPDFYKNFKLSGYAYWANEEYDGPE